MQEIGNDKGEMLVYTGEDGASHVNVRLQGETVWLALDQLAQLFGRDKSTISRHLKNILAEGELVRESVVAKFATTAADGKTYQRGLRPQERGIHPLLPDRAKQAALRGAR